MWTAVLFWLTIRRDIVRSARFYTYVYIYIYLCIRIYLYTYIYILYIYTYILSAVCSNDPTGSHYYIERDLLKTARVVVFARIWIIVGNSDGLCPDDFFFFFLLKYAIITWNIPACPFTFFLSFFPFFHLVWMFLIKEC